MTAMLPVEFADLEPFAATWCLAEEPARWEQRLASSMEEMRAFYDACFPRAEAAITYCDTFDLNALPEDAAIGTLIVVARREGARPLLHLRLVTFAPTLMDIRTRLPAEAMMSSRVRATPGTAFHVDPSPSRYETSAASMMSFSRQYIRIADTSPPSWPTSCNTGSEARASTMSL